MATRTARKQPVMWVSRALSTLAGCLSMRSRTPGRWSSSMRFVLTKAAQTLASCTQAVFSGVNDCHACGSHFAHGHRHAATCQAVPSPR